MSEKASAGKRRGRAAVASVVEYGRRMEDYAGQYETALRTVKRWAALGRAAGDPCPLDSPADMPGWWSRNMKHRVPDALFRAAGVAMPAAEPVVAAGAAVPAVDDVPAGRGVEAELERLEHLSARLSRTADQPGQTKAYLDSIQRMTSLQKQVREEAEKARRLIPRDEVEQAIHDREGPIEREMRLLAKTMCEAIGLPLTPKIEEQWHRELDAVFARWQEEIFR